MKLRKIGNIFNLGFIKELCFSSVIIIFCALTLNAQVEVRAEVNTTTVTLNEEVNLTIYISAPTTKIEVPQMPSLPNFNIYSAGQSRQINMINGKVTAHQQFNYILTPRFAGKTTIDPFTVQIDGKDYQTEPIEVEISRQTPSAPRTQEQALAQIRQKEEQKKGSLSNKNNIKLPNFFMTAQTNVKQAYLNEQVT
ncbi:MAG: BatD family protein, partial [Elusimicrobiaceae bacterium]|nr:BatD family protein [Elusimicrobiaceae bacterium]